MTTDFIMTNWPLLVGGLLVLVALVALIAGLARRRQHVALDDGNSVVAPTLARVAQAGPGGPAAAIPPPPVLLEPDSAADDLRRIKGLGPKIATRLGELGIARYDQLATLDDAAQAALDAELGPFAGRMARDRWVEQAALLARGDIATFEAQFGKLG